MKRRDKCQKVSELGVKFSNLKPLFILLCHTFRRCGIWSRVSVPLILNSIAFWLNSFVRLQFPHLWHGNNIVFLSHWAVVMIKGNNACKPLAQCDACCRLFCCLLISWNRKWEYDKIVSFYKNKFIEIGVLKHGWSSRISQGAFSVYRFPVCTPYF